MKSILFVVLSSLALQLSGCSSESQELQKVETKDGKCLLYITRVEGNNHRGFGTYNDVVIFPFTEQGIIDGNQVRIDRYEDGIKYEPIIPTAGYIYIDNTSYDIELLDGRYRYKGNGRYRKK